MNWIAKILFKISPRWGMKYMASKFGIENPVFDQMHTAFREVEEVDIHPFEGGQRGFALVLNRNTALYFVQKGDHFVYEGFEMGKYDSGDVTLFDRFR